MINITYGGYKKLSARNLGKLYKGWLLVCGKVVWTRRFYYRAREAEAYGKRVAERLIRWRDFLMAQEAANSRAL